MKVIEIHMTNKPPLAGAMLTIVIALVTGLASGLPLWRKGLGADVAEQRTQCALRATRKDL